VPVIHEAAVYQDGGLIRPDLPNEAGVRPVTIGFAPRLAALYAALFATVGVQLPFFPLWLEAKGLDPQAIGLVLASPMLLRLALIPAVARIADRTGALRGTIVATLAAATVGIVAVAFAEGAIAIATIAALALAAWNCANPLTETYAFKGLRHSSAYGPVRLWGSAAFIAGSFLAGAAADALPARDLIWLIVAAFALSLLAAAALRPVSAAVPPPGNAAPARRLLTDGAFVAAIVGGSLIQASHAVYYGFATLAWTQRGLDGTSIAALWALGVAAEIVLFWLSARLPPSITPLTLIVIGGAAATIRWLGMAVDPPTVLLPPLQVLHALSFGASHLGALGFIARVAPQGRGATAQAYYAMANGIVTAGAMALSGWLYAASGASAYLAMALAAAAGCVCGIVAARMRQPAM
jgi:PPP family 3-phenylpropionic acid transporter